MLTLTQKAFVLQLHPVRGTFQTSEVPPMIVCTMLMELVQDNMIGIQKKRVHVISTTIPDNPLKAEAMALIRAKEKPQKIEHWIQKIHDKIKHIDARVADALVQQNVLNAEAKKIIGLFPTTHYFLNDPTLREQLVNELRDVLRGDKAPDVNTVSLLNTLHSLTLLKPLLEKEERKGLNKRLKELTNDNSIPEALMETITAIHAALLVVAVMAPGAAIAASAGKS